MTKEKNLELERLVFFTDAVVAIAITLLALDLKVEKDEGGITFADLGHLWREFSSLLLSYILIAIYWRVHHQLFHYVRKVDKAILFYNFCWLFAIILLPFSARLLSANFLESVSVLVYSFNLLLIVLFQNQIWDYVAVRPEFLNEYANKKTVRSFRIDCNVVLLNTFITTLLAYFIPLIALILLLLNKPLIVVSRMLYQKRKRKHI